MTIQELRRSLSSPEQIKARPFELLVGIADVLNGRYNGDEHAEHLARDLTLRALEHRELFGASRSALDGLVRELGLFPYLDPNNLDLMDSIAFEFHRPHGTDSEFVFHREQAAVFQRLIAGKNVILSAPTSFGKSRIIDAVIASGRFRNIALIVPTIALIDETRRRLSKFSAAFKIVTQVSQPPSERNIFVFTPERANAYSQASSIDFFAIDEFYKIGSNSPDQKRMSALNQSFYKLLKTGAQFYLLGPSVSHIPDGLEEKLRCEFYPTGFATVASDVIQIKPEGEPLEALLNLISQLNGEPTLVFCKSPKSANMVALSLSKSTKANPKASTTHAADWLRQQYHPDWTLPTSIERGVGVHHGRLPRSLGQYVVRAFNDGAIQTLVCTSTLIEGVNTKAKNVVIFDNQIARQKLDFFTFNNIKGRSGRMFEHFVGRVFLFHPAPERELPFVDFPVYSQGPGTPESILIQLEDSDLTEASRTRLEPYLRQTVLPLDLLRVHSSIEPASLIALANALSELPLETKGALAWTGLPNWDSLVAVCNLAWEHLLGGRSNSGVFSGQQLALKVNRLQREPDIRERIAAELVPGKYAAESADEAVERVFEFDRTWATFELPRILRAFSDVRRCVLGGKGDYAFFAGKLETLFRPSFQVALEEFGIPLQLSDRLGTLLAPLESVDQAIDVLRDADFESLGLAPFEVELLSECQRSL